VNLPQTIPEDQPNLPSTERAPPRETRVNDIGRIQRDIARRRRRNFLALMAKLAVFVGLPTFAAGWYFYVAATPMYATNSEFVIQQADSLGGGGLGGLFQGTSMATQQDSMTVQSYLTSRAAFARLDEEEGFRAHFTDPAIDPIQRLAPESSNEAAFKVYARHVRIGYDPSEGIVRMEVIAADPETSQRFSEALIGYAEEQVDQLTQRLREDRMAGARQSYEEAETRRTAALTEWLRIQQQVQQIDPVGETNARTQQISSLESQRQQLLLELDTRLSVERPNEAQVNSLQMQIANIENLIADLRTEMTQESEAGASLAASNKELRLGEENYAFQTVIVQQALQQMEIARIEANRQVRYLSLGVEPIAPDEATYPRAFENTVVAFLIFSGIYLLISLTAAVLREQVTS
jgi:capsular polysaccharide transport system permease protein